MSEEKDDFPKAFEANVFETKWYRFWESSFKADPNSSKPPYCIVMPPPNVTGVLHMGHALVSTLQDILVRWHRMRGYETLWVPGTDHAGISTQTVVERHLKNTTGKRRQDFTRDEFLAHVWKWKEDNENQILNQLKRCGCSCDWSRLRFTMDQGNNLAVRTLFKKLFDEGLIYRGNYLVNWDPVTQTAIADDEVEYEDKQGFLWFFKYPLKDISGFIHIATTRPETMLGDTAIAVNPNDARFSSLIGKMVLHPITEREIPIIADSFVDPEFGTGMVKITPAHDPNDYEIGLNHHLPFINIMTEDGKINENGGLFVGLTMAEAREKIVEVMKGKNLLEKIVPHLNRIGISYRSKAPIEPYMSKQWFVRMGTFKKFLRTCVEDGKVKLIPKNWENTYFHWIDNLRDWCISRQLWWGHRIPIWYRKDNKEIMICYDGDGVPPVVSENPTAYVQDEDVLDTWFSSALWPFATLGWPEKTKELEKFYPNSILVTGHDILFFWVARMLLMGSYAMGEVPFPESFLHGLIYGKSYWRINPSGGITYVSDKERSEYELGKEPPKDVISKWEKMSKSKGNIIDPIEVIEKYGADAMRMALCASSPQSREIDLDLRKFEEFKNFANKIWNGARFTFMNLEDLSPEELSSGLDEKALALEDKWILSTMNRTIKEVSSHLSNYDFDQAAIQSYDFFWKEFCSYYLEISKPILFGKSGSGEQRKNKQKLLTIILCLSMRLIHPMAPFISEEIFQRLKNRFNNMPKAVSDPYTQDCVDSLKSLSCMTSPYPKLLRESDIDPSIDQTFAFLAKVVYAIRNIRGEVKIAPSIATDIHIVGETSLIKDNFNIIQSLVKVNKIEYHRDEPSLGFSGTAIIEGIKIIIPLPDELVKQELTRLKKEKEKLESSIQRIQLQLANLEFVKNAPQELVEKQTQALKHAENELARISHKLLGNLDNL